MTKNIVSQIHIEAARNSTDDFNLFHDKNRWNWIKNNPFNGPIALGFQLGCFIEDKIHQARLSFHESEQCNRFIYSHFELNFAGVVRPGDELTIEVKQGRASQFNGAKCQTNRVLVKANQKTVLIGNKRESDNPLIAIPSDLPTLSSLSLAKDRCPLAGTDYFLKRKFMIVGNAKNFLTSAFAQQADYIDEFDNKVEFPQMYPLSLISSALLERAQYLNHDLIVEPMIYVCQKLSVNKLQVKSLKSNDKLHILIGPEISEGSKVSHLCIGICNEPEPLFIAQIDLVSLSELVKSK